MDNVCLFRYFNVVADENDLFSRCVICNGDQYIKLARHHLERLWVGFQGFLKTIRFNVSGSFLEAQLLSNYKDVTDSRLAVSTISLCLWTDLDIIYGFAALNLGRTKD